MNIEKIKIGKTYPTGNFSSIRIDVEASIDSESEDVYACLENLKDVCDNYFKANYSEPYNQDQPSITVPVQPKIPTTKTPEDAAKELIETANASNIKWFKHLTDQFPQLTELYNNKLNQLNNG